MKAFDLQKMLICFGYIRTCLYSHTIKQRERERKSAVKFIVNMSFLILTNVDDYKARWRISSDAQVIKLEYLSSCSGKI